ncbi:MAG: 4'-phosphopantetheinyl transferase superfamily protein [Terrimicrobiaceae bacterium]
MISWKRTSPGSDLQDEQVHLWRVDLNVPDPKFGSLRGTLSEEEILRSERFRFPELRRRFAVGRGALRLILAGYLGVEPARVKFGYTAHGKPFLLNSPADIQFNLSHSHGFMVAAICLNSPIGVDIEKKDPRFRTMEIAERFFCDGEKQQIAGLDAGARLEAFFQIWTAKEAVLKATARGLALELAKVEVALSPLRVVALDEGENIHSENWQLIAFQPAEEYCGTLAVAAPPSRVEWRELAL